MWTQIPPAAPTSSSTSNVMMNADGIMGPAPGAAAASPPLNGAADDHHREGQEFDFERVVQGLHFQAQAAAVAAPEEGPAKQHPPPAPAPWETDYLTHQSQQQQQLLRQDHQLLQQQDHQPLPFYSMSMSMMDAAGPPSHQFVPNAAPPPDNNTMTMGGAPVPLEIHAMGPPPPAAPPPAPAAIPPPLLPANNNPPSVPRTGSLATTKAAKSNAFHGKGSFPLNLTLMLESVESMGYGRVISWLPGGTGFAIHDPDRFLDEVLPKFFKSSKNTKLRSFYRKLNRWGFTILRNQTVAHGTGGGSTMRGVWHHPDFYRARAVECLKMAMETGDAGCFLAMRHEAKGEEGEGANAHAASAAKSAGTKRRGTSPASLRDSGTTSESVEVPTFGLGSGGAHDFRASHRESDFSAGTESLDASGLCTTQYLGDGYRLPAPPTVARAPTAAAPGPATTGGLSHSFTGGVPVPTAHPSSGWNAKRGRASVAFAPDADPLDRHRPAFRGGGISASWTAGSTFSPADFDFDPAPFRVHSTSMREDPLSPDGNGGDAGATIEGPFASAGTEARRPPGEGLEEGPREGEPLTTEDMELATFFERFAETLPR